MAVQILKTAIDLELCYRLNLEKLESSNLSCSKVKKFIRWPSVYLDDREEYQQLSYTAKTVLISIHSYERSLLYHQRINNNLRKLDNFTIVELLPVLFMPKYYIPECCAIIMVSMMLRGFISKHDFTIHIIDEELKTFVNNWLELHCSIVDFNPRKHFNCLQPKQQKTIVLFYRIAYIIYQLPPEIIAIIIGYYCYSAVN